MSKKEEFSPDIKVDALIDHPVSLRLKTDGSNSVSYIELVLNDEIKHPDESKFIAEFYDAVKSIKIHYL